LVIVIPVAEVVPAIVSSPLRISYSYTISHSPTIGLRSNLQSQLDFNQLGEINVGIGTAFNVFKTFILFQVTVLGNKLGISSPVHRIISFTSVFVRFGLSFHTKDANHATKGVAIEVQDILTYLSEFSE
jgi:hypothetical protein